MVVCEEDNTCAKGDGTKAGIDEIIENKVNINLTIKKEIIIVKIHEYQAKELFKQYNIPVPEGGVVFSPEEAKAKAKAETLGGYPVVIKAQIHAGGRGKGGGVKLSKNS